MQAAWGERLRWRSTGCQKPTRRNLTTAFKSWDFNSGSDGRSVISLRQPPGLGSDLASLIFNRGSGDDPSHGWARALGRAEHYRGWGQVLQAASVSYRK